MSLWNFWTSPLWLFVWWVATPGYPILTFSNGLHKKISQGMQQTKWWRCICIPNRSSHPLIKISSMQVSLMRSLFEAHHSAPIDGQFNEVGWQRIIASYYYSIYKNSLMLYILKQFFSKHSADLNLRDTNMLMNESRAASGRQFCNMDWFVEVHIGLVPYRYLEF